MSFESESSRPLAPTWPVLKPVAPDLDPRNVCVNRLTCVVGARSRVHWPLKSPLVSRSHALIVVDEREVYVRDLASRNGLQVNGSAVREAPLRGGNLLRFGPAVFQCVAGFRNGAPANGSHRARLESPGSGQGYPIDQRTFLLGRREGCDLVLREPVVSRVHAVIFRRGGRFFVRDLNSKNGIALNGKPVREAELADGDELRLVGHVFRYHVVESAEHPEPAAAAESGDGTWHGPVELADPGDLAASRDLSVTGSVLSASGSVGSQTTVAGPAKSAAADGKTSNEPEATPHDLDWESSSALHAAPAPPDPEQADVNELFAAETNPPVDHSATRGAERRSDNGHSVAP